MSMYITQLTTMLFAIHAIVLTVYTPSTAGQNTQLFNPYAQMGQFPRLPMPTGNGNQGMAFMSNPLYRSPFMNSNSFLGGNYNANPTNAGWSRGSNNNFLNPYGARQEAIYTAIGYDRLDPNSQMRLTITERRGNDFSMYPNTYQNGDGNSDRPTSWYVQGSFLTSQLKNKAGTYHVVLTEGGRTADGCVSESLGEIARPDMVDTRNPFMEYGIGNQPIIMPNKLLVGSSGPTVYASTLDGVSPRQLVGSAIAACEVVQNGICGGYIPFCGTVTKDVLPAMEVPLANTRSRPGVVPFNPNNVFQGGLSQTGGGGLLAVTDPFGVGNPSFSTRNEDERSSSSTLGLLF